MAGCGGEGWIGRAEAAAWEEGNQVPSETCAPQNGIAQNVPPVKLKILSAKLAAETMFCNKACHSGVQLFSPPRCIFLSLPEI